jgi:PIN domain nuclease of toxin-antitoxin system
MLIAIADTHAIVWYALQDPHLSAIARQTMQDAFTRRDEIGVASISLVEIIYLMEKGRVVPHTLQTIQRLLHDSTYGLRLIELDESIAEALATIPRVQVPDMPDRIIAATAVQRGVPCISRDGKIQVSQVPTVW